MVALTGETINLEDPYSDVRFNPEVDKRTGYRTRNLLTMPVKSARGAILGVFQLLNKRQGNFSQGRRGVADDAGRVGGDGTAKRGVGTGERPA